LPDVCDGVSAAWFDEDAPAATGTVLLPMGSPSECMRRLPALLLSNPHSIRTVQSCSPAGTTNASALSAIAHTATSGYVTLLSAVTPKRMENRMNWDRIQGNWKQVTGKAKVQWGKLTDDDLEVIAGHRDQLAGKIQERYGVAKDEAEKQLSAWQSKANDSWFS
jgi:uncharacterized protein YjbJ (UPF0337 family)